MMHAYGACPTACKRKRIVLGDTGLVGDAPEVVVVVDIVRVGTIYC